MMRRRTQKQKKSKKQELWNAFEENVLTDDVECVYDKDMCESCKNPLKRSETNLLICSNAKCGRIIDRLDHKTMAQEE